MNHLGFRDFLEERLNGRKVLIFGFGREGQSTWKSIQTLASPLAIGIADQKHYPEFETIGELAAIHSGDGYLDCLGTYDLIIRSPGIHGKHLVRKPTETELTSQSALFLEYFHSQVIGVTGTKGKSTTSTLIHSMLEHSGCHALLAGNIGLPPFEVAGMMKRGSIAVLELSAHQLEDIKHGPHIGCLLNLFEEHLDHFMQPLIYYRAKWNIFSSQAEQDIGIYPSDIQAANSLLAQYPPRSNMLGFSRNAGVNIPLWLKDDHLCLNIGDKQYRMKVGSRPGLPGHHNLLNCLVAAGAALLSGADEEGLIKAISTYKGLPHRLQYLGEWGGRHYYNDAIATAPEATMAAIETLNRVDTLILGGMDRGIQYEDFADYLTLQPISLICTSGPAGLRIHNLLSTKGFKGKIHFSSCFKDAVEHAIATTKQGCRVLLSPSAPSYDEFSDFTEKGRMFSKIIQSRLESME